MSIRKTSGTFYAPVPITHTIAHCLDRMETAHGNLPRIDIAIHLALGNGYWLCCFATYIVWYSCVY